MEQRNSELLLQGAWVFKLAALRGRSRPRALFARYAVQFGRSIDRLFGLPLSTREGWTLTTGVTVSLF